MLNFLKKLHDQSLELAKHLRFDKDLTADGYAIALYSRLIETTGSIIVLIDNKKVSGSRIVFRAFLETYVDLINTLEDDAYVESIFAAFHKRWIQVLQASSGNNPYLGKIDAHKDHAEILANHEAKLKILESKGYYPLNVFERFSKAGMEDEYRSIYNFGSSETHGDLSALLRSNIRPEGDSYSIVLYEDHSDGTLLTELDSTAGLLLYATRQIHERQNSEFIDQILALEAELAELRAGIIDRFTPTSRSV